jgi:DNA invertase Pin-like site-specific DNA recombinase
MSIWKCNRTSPRRHSSASRSPRRVSSPHWHLMLTILGGLAEFERTLIRARRGDRRKLSAHQRREAIDRIEAGEAVVDVARTFE